MDLFEKWIELNSIGKWIRGFVLVLVYVDVRTNDPHLDSPAHWGENCGYSRKEMYKPAKNGENSSMTYFLSILKCFFLLPLVREAMRVTPMQCVSRREMSSGWRVDSRFKKDNNDSKTTTITITAIQQQLQQ